MSRYKGTRVHIHRSLTEEIMLGGVPRNLAIINGVTGVALGVGGGSILVMPIFVVIHLILAYLHKKDSQRLECLRRYFYMNYLRRYYET